MGAETLRQFGIIFQAPIPFVICLIILGSALWKVFQWRYSTILETYEHRLKLRDDDRTFERKGANNAKTDVSVKFKIDAEDNTYSDNIGQLSYPRLESVAECNINPGLLRKIYRNRTALQADRLAALYTGKRMVVSGLVRSVHAPSYDGGDIVAYIKDDGSNGLVEGIWLSFSRDHEKLEILSVDDRINVNGEIKKFGQFDVELRDCYLV